MQTSKHHSGRPSCMPTQNIPIKQIDIRTQCLRLKLNEAQAKFQPFLYLLMETWDYLEYIFQIHCLYFCGTTRRFVDNILLVLSFWGPLQVLLRLRANNIEFFLDLMS